MEKYKIGFWDTFYKSQLPSELPQEILDVIDRLKKTGGREECLKKAYDVLTSKYRGYRFRTLLFPHVLFKRDLEKIWSLSGFLYCNQMNYLLRLLLVKSGWFQDEDIELKWTLIWHISLHQYCRVKLSEKKYINVDIWAKAQGFPLGDYAHGFHSPEKFETIIDFTKLKKGGVEVKELLSRFKEIKKK